MIDFKLLQPSATCPEVSLPVQAQVFDAAVVETREHLERLGPDYFRQKAETSADLMLHHEGTRYAVVSSDEDASRETAILMPTTFVNDIWPHWIARGEAVAHMAAKAGLRDRSGNTVPVVITAAPGVNSTFGLDREARHAVSHGDFTPIAKRQLETLSRGLGYGMLQGYIGYSQAAAFTERIMGNVYRYMDSAHVALIGEPPHGKKRSVVASALAFGREGPGFNAEVNAEGIELVGDIISNPEMGKSFIRGFKEHAAIVRGFGRGGLTHDLINLQAMHVRTTLLHASNSKVAPAGAMQSAFREAVHHTRTHADTSYLRLLEMRGTNHSLGDRLGRFAVLAAASLTNHR